MIKAENLTKRFDDIVAVDHITAEIKEGCVFGLIGTNGSGKSTFLRMASGILKPDEGSITIDGEEEKANSRDPVGGHRNQVAFSLVSVTLPAPV